MLEDDWLLCRNGLLGVQYVAGRATREQPSWVAIRVSYGFNGILFKVKDLPSFSDYLQAHMLHKPPDHVFYDWTQANAPRPLVVFKHNLFYHIGSVSAVKNPNSRFIPSCYEVMYDWLQDHERFDRLQCGSNDDISPCNTNQPSDTSDNARESVSEIEGRFSFMYNPSLEHACSVAMGDRPRLFASQRSLDCGGS